MKTPLTYKTILLKTVPTLLLTAILASCAATPQGVVDELVGKIWLLNGLNGKPPIPGTSITLEFREGGKASGSAGCNSYTTTYTLSRDSDGEQFLTFGQETATTLMSCPEEIMDQESTFLEVLQLTATYGLFGDELVLKDSEGKNLATFTTATQSLEGTSWKVISYNTGTEAVQSVILDTKITAFFGKVGQLSGNAGCNDYTANFETDGEQIQIGPAVTTRKNCESPEGIMEQEAQYLAALEAAATFVIVGQDMEMRDESGSLAVIFSRAVSP